MSELEVAVHVASPDTLDKKTAACAASAKAGEMLAMADFDRTVTRCFVSGGGRGTSAHGVLEQTKVLSEVFQGRAKELFTKYYPVEIDASMPIEDKIPIMREWYGQVHNLMLEENVTRESITKAVSNCTTIQLRDGIADFIRLCQEAMPPIPVLIMSAGLGDVIEEFLKQHLPFDLAPTTRVVSNRMCFNDEGRLTGFSEPLLHMFNKTAEFVPEDAQPLLESKQHCLILGDSVGDLTMADGIDKPDKLKVGFLNEKVEERMSQFLGPFDVVVTNDGSVPDVCFRAIGTSTS